ncbi:MAG: hypothetical protein ACO2ON_03840 [Candidatus Nanopusillus sp.]
MDTNITKAEKIKTIISITKNNKIKAEFIKYLHEEKAKASKKDNK